MLLRLIAILVLVAVVVSIGSASTQRNAGHFTYALDDTYVQLAVARNVSAFGNWGVEPDRFSACTSSLAWPLLLALLGAAATWGIWVPLALNLVLASLALWFVDRWLQRESIGWVVRAAALTGFVFVVPLGVLTLLGLEHVAQIALALLTLRWGIRRCDARRVDHDPLPWGLLLAAALVATSVPGILLVAPLAWFLRRSGHRTDAALFLLAGLAPLILFGSVSLYLGGRFLPTPVWMNGKLAPELLPLIQRGVVDPMLWLQFVFEVAIAEPARSLSRLGALGWLFLAGLAQVVWVRTRGVELVGVSVVLAAAWLHIALVQRGWMGRQEAWLIALFLVVLAPPAQRMFDRARAGHLGLRIALPLLALVFVALPVRARVASTHFQVNRGSTNVYEQQVQVARFVVEHRSGETVALSDVGVVAWLADLPVVDLWGLSDVDVAERRLAGTLNPVEVEWVARVRGAKVAVLHHSTLDDAGGAPPQWVRVAEWRIHRNAVSRSSTLFWYATSHDEAPRLREQLQAWAPELPTTVDVTWN